MIDIEKQITYWRDSALEEWEVANELLMLERTRHALFLAHLALEKMLKAHVCHQTQVTPPKIHNLSRLIALTSLDVDKEYQKFLAEMNRFQIETRYSLNITILPNQDQVKEYWSRTEEVLQWLNKQF